MAYTNYGRGGYKTANKPDFAKIDEEKQTDIMASQAITSALGLAEILVEKGRIEVNPASENPLKERDEWVRKFAVGTGELIASIKQEVKNKIKETKKAEQEKTYSAKDRARDEAERDIAQDSDSDFGDKELLI